MKYNNKINDNKIVIKLKKKKNNKNLRINRNLKKDYEEKNLKRKKIIKMYELKGLQKVFACLYYYYYFWQRINDCYHTLPLLNE